MIVVGLHFAGAAAETLPAICWQTAPSEYAILRRFAQRVPEHQTAGSDAVDTAAHGLIAYRPNLNHKAAAGRRWSRNRCALRRLPEPLRAPGSVAGAATGAGAGVGSLPSSTPVANVVGAPRKPLLFTGAPVVSSLCSVSLLIGRTSPAG